MSLANYITFIRIFVSPIFLLVYILHNSFGINELLLPYVLLFLLGVSELSDAFDGYIARKYDQVSDFGKIFDPMADSIARISVLLTFTQPPVSLPLPLIFVFLYRDSVISTLRTICALKGFALAARTSGKIKAVIQAIAAFCILFLMIPESMGVISQTTLQFYSSLVVSVAAFYALFSGADYLYANRSYIKRLLQAKPKKKFKRFIRSKMNLLKSSRENV